MWLFEPEYERVPVMAQTADPLTSHQPPIQPSMSLPFATEMKKTEQAKNALKWVRMIMKDPEETITLTEALVAHSDRTDKEVDSPAANRMLDAYIND